MEKLALTAIMISILFTGCSSGFANMQSTLKEEPFVTEIMRGSVDEAIQCVGQYWKNSVLPSKVWWKARPEALPLLASGIGIGRWEPPVSLVIDFVEADGRTTARAHIHHSMSSADERRTIAIDALTACRDNSRYYYAQVRAIVLKTGDIVEGQILSIEDDEVKMRTREGRILLFSFMNDVKKYIMK